MTFRPHLINRLRKLIEKLTGADLEMPPTSVGLIPFNEGDCHACEMARHLTMGHYEICLAQGQLKDMQEAFMIGFTVGCHVSHDITVAIEKSGVQSGTCKDYKSECTLHVNPDKIH